MARKRNKRKKQAARGDPQHPNCRCVATPWAAWLPLTEQPGRAHLGLAPLSAGKDTNKTLAAVPGTDLAGVEIDPHSTVVRPLDQVQFT